MDPRLTNLTEYDLDEQFRLAVQVRDKTSEANEMVIRIRALKAQIKERMDKTRSAPVTVSGLALGKKLGAVEEDIYQVRNRSNQDPLNFPIKLNNQLAALQRIIAPGDGRPTEQSNTVFREL